MKDKGPLVIRQEVKILKHKVLTMYLLSYIIHWRTLTERKVNRIEGTLGKFKNVHSYQVKKNNYS